MPQRRLVAIMFTDIVGYTSLMGESESKAFQTINTNREIHQRYTEKHHGKIVKELGDGLLIVFENGTEAVLCAIDIQKDALKNKISLRIGIHEGEVVFENSDVFGDGINIASRLQGEAAVGGICISDAVNRIIKNQESLLTEPIGRKKLKNVSEAIKLYQIIADGISTHSKIPKQKIRSWHLIIAIFLGIILGWFLNTVWDQGKIKTSAYHMSIGLPGDTPLYDYTQSSIDISPDGQTIIFISSFEGESQIFKRFVSEKNVYPIKGTENARNPFFSPDGKWIGFFANGKLKKVLASGGISITICDVMNFTNATWLPNGNIIYGVLGVGLKIVSDEGGEPEVFSAINWSAGGEWRYLNPAFFSKHNLLFYAVVNIDCKSSKIICRNIKTNEEKVIIKNAGAAQYLPNGYLVYYQDGCLMAATFDPKNMEITGSSNIIIEDYSYSERCTDPRVNVSLNGTLIYLSGMPGSYTLCTVDFNGDSRSLYTGDLFMYGPKYSPDGKTIAMVRSDENEISHVWTLDVDRIVVKKITDEGSNFWPIWTPDGERVTYPSLVDHENGEVNIFWKDVSGNSKAQRLTESKFWQQPISWSKDGNILVIHQSTLLSSENWGVHYISMDSNQIIKSYLDSDYNEKWPALSPDGKLIAYSSDETGQFEVYVSAFPEIKFKHMISNSGGTEPIWSKDEKELYYRNNYKIMKVPFEIDPNFVPGKPIMLFEKKYNLGSYGLNYDISPSGDHFLMVKSELPNQEILNEINIIQNFFEEVEQKLGE